MLSKMKAVVFCFVAIFAVALAATRILEDTEIVLPNSDDHMHDRIISGRQATIKDFPYTVSLRLDGRHESGGSVLTATSALTSAHQIRVGQPPSRYSIKAGSDYRQDRPDPHAQIRTVSLYIVHPNFETSTLRYDIAIVKWAQPLVFGAYAQPVVIPPPNYEVPYGKLAHTTGWGWTNFIKGERQPERLHEMRTPLVDNRECNRAQGGRITGDQICAGTMAGVEGICKGDIGAPLVYKSNNKFLLVGVASWSRGCAQAGLLDVYARVPYFTTWIRNQLEIL